MANAAAIIPLDNGINLIALSADATATGNMTQAFVTVRTLAAPAEGAGTALARAFALSFGSPTADASAITGGTLDGYIVQTDTTHGHIVTVDAGPISLAQAVSVMHLSGATAIIPL